MLWITWCIQPTGELLLGVFIEAHMSMGVTANSFNKVFKNYLNSEPFPKMTLCGRGYLYSNFY